MKVKYRRADEHPHAGTTELTFIRRLTERQRELDLIRSIHGSGISDEPMSSDRIGFDGGARPPGPGHRSPRWYASRSLQLPRGWQPTPDD